MARSSLATLIAAVRDLIGDAAGAAQVFSDDQIQTKLDNRRRDVWLLSLTGAPTVAQGGAVAWFDWYAPDGNWEANAVVQDNTYKPLTSSTSPIAVSTADYSTGRWTLSASTYGPIFVTGKQFDLNGAAADLLDDWATKLKLEFDFLSTGRTFKRHQQLDALNTQANRLRARQWIGYSQMIRTDMNGTSDV